MADYSSFIDSARRAKPTPEHLVDEKGNCAFGTFTDEFRDLNLLQAKQPTHLPQFLNRQKLTQWEACEIHLKEGTLLSVICDMGLFGKILHVWHDRENGTITAFDHNLASKDTGIAANLLDGCRAYAKTDKSDIEYINDFGNGAAHLKGHAADENNQLEYAFQLTQVCPASIVSIPFDRNRPLYTEKMMFAAKGILKINGRIIECDDFSTAIIDDHRGYYPRRMHYDWVSAMGRYEINGKMQYFGFNLTRNQSIDQRRYNENLIFFENRTSILPPVSFSRSEQTRADGRQTVWKVRDDHDMVSVDCTMKAVHPTVLHAGAVNIDYYFTLGTVQGYLRDEQGNKIPLDGIDAMGEDKTMLF